MLTVYTVLIALALIATAVVAMALKIIFVKGGRFPDTHICHNKALRAKGIVCASTFDRKEQEKALAGVDFSTLKLDNSTESK